MHSINAPFAKELIKQQNNLKSSFHALPIGGYKSLNNKKIFEIYSKIYGESEKSEITLSGNALDSFFFPTKSLLQAERLAAQSFGADTTLFVTCGTTIANAIALAGLLQGPKIRVLADKGTHQSIHFCLADRNALVDYVEPQVFCNNSERSSVALDDITEALRAAERAKNPYRLLILNGHTYDGVQYDMVTVLRAVRAASASLETVFVDEAWGAWSYFHPQTRGYTAICAGRALAEELGLQIVVTQSAHKSISALRQGSYVHVIGSHRLSERLREARYRIHTTSPSYAILASLDLARAQMDIEGADLVENCLRLARKLEHAIETNPRLSAYALNTWDKAPAHLPIIQDSTKISLNVSKIPLTVTEFKNFIFNEYGVYINRCTKTSVLINIHIGVKEKDIDNLISALEKIQEFYTNSTNAGLTSKSFVIPYPPGVPVLVPGEVIGEVYHAKLDSARRAGAHIFSIVHR
jgi:arginine decarboxylase